MPFGRSAKPNNRSQHNLAVESAASSSSTGAQSVSVSVSSTASGAGIGPGPISGVQGIPGIGVSTSGAQAQQQVNHQPSPGPGPGLTQLQGQGSSSSASALGQGSANLPLTSNDSYVQDLRAVSQNHQLPPPQLYGPSSGRDLPPSPQDLNHPQAQAQAQLHQLHQLHPLNTGTVVSDAEARKAASKFVDAVTRSQSQRYNTVATPIQPNPSFGASYEDLTRSLQATPQDQQSLAYHHHQQHQQHQQQHQQQQYAPPPQPPPQSAPVEPRRSTRRLIKNILGGTPRNDTSRSGHSHHPSESQSQSQSHNFYDNSTGLTRRPSKRISNPNPPTLRTGPSQVSLDQQSLDWHSQGPQSQPSPLQTNPHDFQQPTLRRVPTNQDQSPYSDIDESGLRHQTQAPTQLTPDYEHQGQVAFDPATRQYHYIAHSSHNSPQGSLQPDGNPPAYPGHLAVIEHLRNPETISQVSHESPVGEGDQQNPSAVPSTDPSPARYSAQAHEFPSRTSSLQPQQQQQLGQQHLSPEDLEHQRDMAPPSGGPPQVRGEMQQGPPPGYRHSSQPSKSTNPVPAGAQVGAGPNNFRQSTIQERPPQQFDGPADQGRNSPQPSEDPEKAFKDLLQKYKNVKRLYFDGKTQIEQLNGQVEQLQNAVANQRISQSRTALDDSEYTTRFNRLNGAINNLSFNIRKDWTSLPPWLDKYVSADALKTGKQEMTAVGRAVITRWIVEEIFYSCFHPGLDPELSRQLKSVEQNIRRFSYTLTSQEEFDALTSKVVSWRMTTLEGLQDVLNSAESANYRQEFTRNATANLTACLFQYLADPPPAGVDGSASMIVELAVGIAANLPLESRDVAILYPLPQDGVQPEVMDVEKAPLPAIETRPPESEGDGGGEDGGKESGGEKSNSKERNKSRAGTSALSTISSLLSNAPAPVVPAALVPGGSARKDSLTSTANASVSSIAGRKSTSLADSTTNLALPPKDGNKVRFAGFLAVEVRGRQVLVKAPIWTLA